MSPVRVIRTCQPRETKTSRKRVAMSSVSVFSFTPPRTEPGSLPPWPGSMTMRCGLVGTYGCEGPNFQPGDVVDVTSGDAGSGPSLTAAGVGVATGSTFA